MYLQNMTLSIVLTSRKLLTEQCRDCEGVYIEGNKVKSYNIKNKSIYFNSGFY